MDDFQDVCITRHAVKKYKTEMRKRFGALLTDNNARDEIKQLLRDAIEEDKKSGLVRRIIENEFSPAMYYLADDWRFVLVQQDNYVTLVTVERNWFRDAPPGYISKASLFRRTKRGRILRGKYNAEKIRKNKWRD